MLFLILFLFLFQTLSKGLVMWDTVLPTFEWLKNNVPEVISYTVKSVQYGHLY